MPKTDIDISKSKAINQIKDIQTTAGDDDSRTAYSFFKRIFDIIFSAIGLIVLSPLMLIVAIIIKIDSSGPVLFKQNRVGKGGTIFMMYKFRSMCTDAEIQLDKLKKHNQKDGPVFKIFNDPRVTRFGRIIRRTSIDELPQLVNILKGDMSFVGPRPPIPYEVSQYNDYQLQRITVKPGLTCYWQIGGRSNLSFDDWIELDIKYIHERSFWTDLKILLRTLPAVLRRDGAY